MNTLLNQVYIQFTTQLLLATLPAVLNAPKRKQFQNGRGSFALRAVIGLVFLYGFEFLLSRWFTSRIGTPIAFFFYVLTAIAIWCVMMFCFDLDSLTAMYYSVEGYAIEHMAYVSSVLIIYVTGWNEETLPGMVYTIVYRYLFYAIFAVASYVVFFRKSRMAEQDAKMDRRILLLSAVLVVLAIYFSIIYAAAEDSFITRVICPVYGFACCGFVLLLGNGMVYENRLEKEQKEMEQMLSLARTQQEASREAIDIINIKCHDLKHSLRKIEAMSPSAERMEYIKEITDAIDIYDADYHTGYEELDYVLREKALICKENQIELSCIADGSLLKMISSVDIYSLMGNILDNAIEREKEEAVGSRFISIKIVDQAGMTILSVENFCSEDPGFVNGLPETTKKDKNFHGFGTKSIKYIVEKYGGEVTMDIKNQAFRVHAIF